MNKSGVSLARLSLFAIVFLLLALVIVPLPALAADNPKQGGVSAQQPPEGHPAPDVLPYWVALQARSRGPVAASWNAGGAPRSLFGDLSESASPSEAAARRFLSENGPLFKINTGDLARRRDVDSPMGHHFEFEQRYRGVPVYGGEVKISYNRGGRIVAVNNSYVPGVTLASTRPAIDEGRARGTAGVNLPAGDYYDLPQLPEPDIRLVVYPLNGAFLLAWEIEQATNGPTWQMFIDAQNGQLLGAPVDINRYVTGSGRVFLVNAVVATRDNTLRDNRDSASAVPPAAYRVVSLQGLAGNGYLDGPYASSKATKKRVFAASNSFQFDRSSDGFSETMGYYYIDYAERYIQSLGFANVNNRQQVFSVNSYKQDNSYYSPSTKQISYGLGGVDDAEDAEVIWHEYGHSIQDNQVPGFGSTLEAGSMGEGFGDYWAGSVGAQFSGGFQDVCLAEWDATSYSTSDPPCLRRLDGTKHYPQDVQREVHADGEIWSAALWQIRAAIGATKADTVVLQAHSLLARSASFNDGSNALVIAATNLGYTRKEVDAIRTILQNRGFTVSQ